MPLETYTNGASSSLDGAIDASQTTIDLNLGSGFPLANFSLHIDNEIMHCSSRTGNTLTVMRGAESTTPATHTDTTSVYQIITGNTMEQYRLNIMASMGMLPDEVSQSADDDEFDDENFSGWTKVWSGTSPTVTELEENHTLSLLLAGGGAAAQFCTYLKAKSGISGGDYIQVGFSFDGRNNQYPHFNLVMSDGATYGAGKQTMVAISPNETNWYLRAMTNFNNNVGQLIVGMSQPMFGMMIHIRMEYISSDTYNVYCSLDGIIWVKIFDNNNYHTVGVPTHYGFGVGSWGGESLTYNLKYFRFSW